MKNIMIQTDDIIAPFCQTRYLVVSSFFFIIPATYACVHNLYLYSLLLGLTTIISANYWRKATYSWRRNMDLIFSKVSFAIYIYNGIKYSHSIKDLIEGLIRLMIMVYYFRVSGELFKIKDDSWYKYHVVFHILIALEQMRILNNIIKGTNI